MTIQDKAPHIGTFPIFDKHNSFTYLETILIIFLFYFYYTYTDNTLWFIYI